MILTPEELAELTGKRKSPSQKEVLRFMGIEHRVRPDGTIAVSRSHVEAALGGNVSGGKKEKPIEPNWSALT